MGSGGYIKNSIYCEYHSYNNLIDDNDEIDREIIVNENINQNIQYNTRSFLEMMNFYFNYPFVILNNAYKIFLQNFKKSF